MRVALLAVLSLVLLSFFPASGSAGPNPRCGETITESLRLISDLNCTRDGLTLGADNLVLDLGGHTISGPGKGPWVWPDPARSSVGIHVSGRKGVVIKNGRVKGFATGILAEDSEDTRIEKMRASSNHYGVYLLNSTGGTLEGSEITLNVYGLHLMSAKRNRVVKNHIFQNHHGSPGGYGICLMASSENLIEENTVEDNMSQGIWLIKSWDNRIYRNNLTRNSPNAVDESGLRNLWHDAEKKVGNFWDDYKGQDLDRDGIGDAPHEIWSFGAVADPYPVMEMNGWRRRGL